MYLTQLNNIVKFMSSIFQTKDVTVAMVLKTIHSIAPTISFQSCASTVNWRQGMLVEIYSPHFCDKGL